MGPQIFHANPDGSRLKYIHASFPRHGSSVVTHLTISHGRIISASDDHTILIHALATGELIHTLHGHEGGVWSIAVKKDVLVSGSTDRTVRIWDLTTGRCTHVFWGHTSTVRCLAIVQPEWVEVENGSGVTTKEKWPKRSLIISGSRDHSLRVWTLPWPTEMGYGGVGEDDTVFDPPEVCCRLGIFRPLMIRSSGPREEPISQGTVRRSRPRHSSSRCARTNRSIREL